MGHQEIGDAPYRIDRRIAQVDHAVAVEVDRVLAYAAGHELRPAHRAGVGAAQRERVDVAVARKEQGIGQFAAEVFHPRRTGWRVRIGKRQRGHCVHYTEASGVAAIHGFDPEDADDDVGRHAVLLFGAPQRLAVVVPEIHAGVDAHRFDKTRAVSGPVFGPPGRCRFHQLDRAVNEAHLAERRFQFGPAETIPGHHVVDEGAHLTPLAEVGEFTRVVCRDGSFANLRGALARFGSLGLAPAEKGGSKEEGKKQPAWSHRDRANRDLS